MTHYAGIRNLELDAPDQIEYNRQKNIQQDSQIATINSQLAELLAQAPAGFLPKVYYGLTRGAQTYRFSANTILDIEVTGEVGTAYELYSNSETDSLYIPAIAIKKEDGLEIVMQGDYRENTLTFSIVNMTTGSTISHTFDSAVLSLQNASYLGGFPAANYKNKQITALNNLETNSQNAIFVSIDINSDNVYNWVEIGGFTNGTDGKSVYSINSATYSDIIDLVKEGDTLIAAEGFTEDGITYAIGDVALVSTLSPLNISLIGNIRGAQGLQGIQGNPGNNGTDGYTPYIQNDYWYINGANTGVKALGTDGINGQNGQSFQMQSGLYSTPDNWGETGNVDGESNPLLQLPTLPQSSITGKGYVVYDPLTTPLTPFYDLYYANNGDVSWTIMHPFSGIAGTNGNDGHTPYIQNGNWYINGVDTGVPATGPQGVPGQNGTTGAPGPVGATFTYNYQTGELNIITP